MQNVCAVKYLEDVGQITQIEHVVEFYGSRKESLCNSLVQQQSLLNNTWSQLLYRLLQWAHRKITFNEQELSKVRSLGNQSIQRIPVPSQEFCNT
jgi:hypothetical protein